MGRQEGRLPKTRHDFLLNEKARPGCSPSGPCSETATEGTLAREQPKNNEGGVLFR